MEALRKKSLGDLVDIWLAESLRRTPLTTVQYRRAVVRWLWWLPSQRPADLTTESVRGYLRYLIDEKQFKLGTVRCYQIAIRCFVRWLRENDYIRMDVCKGVELPTVHIGPPAYLTREQLEDILVLARWHGCYYEVAVASYTGMRTSEMIHLAWQDVDFEIRRIQVRAIGAKGKRARFVPLHRQLQDDLAGLRRVLRPAGSAPVFAAAGGGRRDKSVWGRQLAKIKADYPEWPDGIGGHLFRHTFATLLGRSGVSLDIIGLWLGHRNINVTRDYYANLVPSGDDERIDLL